MGSTLENSSAKQTIIGNWNEGNGFIREKLHNYKVMVYKEYKNGLRSVVVTGRTFEGLKSHLNWKKKLNPDKSLSQIIMNDCEYITYRLILHRYIRMPSSIQRSQGNALPYKNTTKYRKQENNKNNKEQYELQITNSIFDTEPVRPLTLLYREG